VRSSEDVYEAQQWLVRTTKLPYKSATKLNQESEVVYVEDTVYVTVKMPPSYHQMTLEELLFGAANQTRQILNPNVTSTRTYKTKNTNRGLRKKADALWLIERLRAFNKAAESVREKPRESLYETFYVAKKNKGMSALFKGIFACQDRYIGCNSSVVMGGVAAKVRQLLVRHSTVEDENLTSKTANECAEYLRGFGFEMTAEKFKSLITDTHRRIDAPNDELKTLLNTLKGIFEDDFHALYHTSAFAYIKHRSTIDAVKRHQQNESRWFGKFDLKNFFGSTTVDFIMEMLSMIYPFSEVTLYVSGKEELRKALSLCVLRDVLPQGTPISPLITNIMMIPVDHELCNKLRGNEGQRFVYTRYADDFLVSSKYDFDFREIEKVIMETLQQFNAPFTLNTGKTRYGSSAGSNWNLGVMLNKDNKITVGYKKKRQFQAMLTSYILDRKNGHPWEIGDVRVLEGYRNYYRMVEGETIDNIINHLSQKFGVNIVRCIKEDLKS